MKEKPFTHLHIHLQKPLLACLLVVLLAASCAPAPAPTAYPAPTSLPATAVPPNYPPPTFLPTLPTGIQMSLSNLSRITNPAVPQNDQDELAAGNRAFAAGLYQKLRATDGNLIFSPYSISLALAMTYGGARGDTAAQIASAMHFTLPAERLHPAFNALDLYLASLTPAAAEPTPTPEGSVTFGGGDPFQLNIANSTWGQKDFTFLPAYLDLLAQNYGAGMRLTDFAGASEAARLAINDWVSQQTKDKIKDLFPAGSLDASTRLALVNAIYFKASWLHSFDPASTQTGVFHLKDGAQVNVPMMTSGKAADSYFKGDNFQAVSMPYLGEKVSMVIVLPDAGQWDAFESGLTAGSLTTLFQGLKYSDVNLTFPKFKTESSFGLEKNLADMGMPDAFDPNKADFSGMDGNKDLFISAVIHKAYIAVDEQGTEAAAATGVAIQVSAAMGTPPTVIVDRPFLFFIYDQQHQTILFAGRVMDPTK